MPSRHCTYAWLLLSALAASTTAEHDNPVTCFRSGEIDTRATTNINDCRALASAVAGFGQVDALRQFYDRTTFGDYVPPPRDEAASVEIPFEHHYGTCFVTVGTTSMRGGDDASWRDVADAIAAVTEECLPQPLYAYGGTTQTGDNNDLYVEITGRPGMTDEMLRCAENSTTQVQPQEVDQAQLNARSTLLGHVRHLS